MWDNFYLAYQGENEDPNQKKDPAAKDLPKEPDRPIRVIYVDPTTGLPMRSVFGRANKLDKPIFEANYSYPIDIKIDAPAVIQLWICGGNVMPAGAAAAAVCCGGTKFCRR